MDPRTSDSPWPPEQGEAPDPQADVCAACGTPLIAAKAHLSSDGPVCEACHKAASAVDRRRNVARESNVNALLGGIFSVLGGAWLLVTALGGVIFVKLSLIAVIVVVGAVATVLRMQTTAAHGTLGKGLVVLGAIAGALGLVGVLAALAGQ
jgi:hypothetical protein